MLSELDLAYATYSAMQEPPGFVYIAERLMSTSGGVRKRLVEKTPPDILEKALAYLASPEALRERERRMEWMRADPVRITMLKVYYRANLADFIHDWGVTSDPREIATGKMALVPFHLWPKQREMINWMIDCWKKGKPASVVKGRDVGASWCAMALLCAWCIFEKSFAGGIGSATELKLDRSGDPDTLMWKAREFLKHLPEEFRGGYDEQKNSHYLRLTFPETGSSITGEAGDHIGRGGRKSCYIIDEAAFLDRPQLVDASLSMNTNCRIDISTPHGVNSFFDRVHNPALERFDLTWRAQPLDAEIITPLGIRKMGDLEIGDLVIGADGKSTPITNIYPQGMKEIFRVSFDDGSSAECCDSHLWEVIPCGNQRTERRHLTETRPLSVIRADFARLDSRGFVQNLYQVPLTAPIEFSTESVPFDPYVVGCLLGDGNIANTKNTIGLASNDPEIPAEISRRLPEDMRIRYDGGLGYRIVAPRELREKGRGTANPLGKVLRELGLCGTTSYTKFIPDVYKYAPLPSQRLDLLRGLFDTDGHAPLAHRGAVKYSSVSERLARDVAFVVQSLGGTAKISTINTNCPTRTFPGGRKCKTAPGWLVIAKLPDGVVPFILPRKASRIPLVRQRPPRRSITSIEPRGEKECRCIQVGNDNGLYLTNQCIVTHNCDPRKDRAWYEKKKGETDPVVFAQEIDASFYASAEGILIPPQWVQAAVNLFAEMNIEPTGVRTSALDVADLGKDRCAWIFRNGNNIEHAVSWTGTGSDIHGTTAKAFVLCDMYGVEEMVFDANGIGAGVRAAARVLNEERIARGQKPIVVLEYVSSNTPLFPDRIVPGTNRKAKDMFLNRAAQSAWHLRSRFENAYKARNGESYDAENLIGVNPAIPELSRMIAEFSQPQVKETASGKWQLVKTPAGTRSPNFYDSIAMGFSSMKRPMFITEDVLVRAARAGSDMLAAVLGAGERGA